MGKMNVVKNKSNTNTNKNRLNWFDNNSFFDNEEGYNGFIDAMKFAAEQDNLPMFLSQVKPNKITMYDIKEFSNRFKKDTGLGIEFKISTCDCCGELECLIVVDKIEATKSLFDDDVLTSFIDTVLCKANVDNKGYTIKKEWCDLDNLIFIMNNQEYDIRMWNIEEDGRIEYTLFKTVKDDNRPNESHGEPIDRGVYYI